MDHLAGVVVHDLRAWCRQGMAALVHRTLRGGIAPDHDDVIGRFGRRPRRHIQLRVIEAGRLGESMGTAVEADRRDDGPLGRVDERDAVVGRGRDPGDVLDLDAGQAPVRDGLLELLPGLVGARTAEDHRRAGRGELGLEVGGLSAQRLGQDGGLGGGILEGCDRRDDGRADAAVGEVGEARQVEPADHGAGREVDRVEMVARSDHQRRSVLGQVEQVHTGGHLADRQGRDP